MAGSGFLEEGGCFPGAHTATDRVRLVCAGNVENVREYSDVVEVPEVKEPDPAESPTTTLVTANELHKSVWFVFTTDVSPTFPPCIASSRIFESSQNPLREEVDNPLTR